MQTLTQVKTFLRSNSPAILSGTAIVGVVSTGVLSAKAGYSIGVNDGFEDGKGSLGLGGRDAKYMDRKEKIKYYARKYWRDILPPVSTGAAAIGCIVLVNRVHAGRTAAATAAYALADQTLTDYRDKVVEKFGEKKDEEIKAEIAQDRVNKDQPRTDAIIVTSAGNQLCQEAYTGRYFLSDMETLRRAQNDLNAMLIQQDMVTLSEWYHMIGLQPTTHDHDMGWFSDTIMELEFSGVITEDGRPCMVFEYNYIRPLYDR